MVSRATTWLAENRTTEGAVFRIGRVGDRLIAEWVGLCTLYAGPDAVELVPAPHADLRIIDKLHRGLANALLRHRDGRLTLHASAARLGHTTLACLGESGAGKSTQVAALVQGMDAALVSDDTLAVEFKPSGRPFIVPTEIAHWLRPDARAALGLEHHDGEQKVPIEPAKRAQEEVPLSALVFLTFEPTSRAPALRRLHGHELLTRLLPSVIRFVLDDPAAHRRELEQLSHLVKHVPAYELSRPKDLSQLDRINILLTSVLTSLG